MHKLEANITYSRYTNACPNEVSFQSANSTFKMGKAAIPGLGGGVVPPEANITQRTHGSFTCSEVNNLVVHAIVVHEKVMMELYKYPPLTSKTQDCRLEK